MFGFFKKKQAASGGVARDRLSVQLEYDRAGLNPEILENIKRDIFAALSKHLEYDANEVDIKIGKSREGDGGRNVLRANIPIRKIRRR